MQQAFLDVNGIRTSVLTYGKWVEESGKSTEPENIILIIPGSPGVTGLYKIFMHTLHERTGYPVWIVGHAGHEIPKNNTIEPIPKLKGNEKLFGVQGQINHKVDFIKRYVPENAKIHLIGHSFGSHIILNLLKDESIKSKLANIDNIALLFPAIENLPETPQGKFYLTFVKPLFWLIILLSMIFKVLPSVLQSVLVFAYFKVVGMPIMHFKTFVESINPSAFKTIFFITFNEMDQIKERDNAIIRQHLDKLKFLYGVNDRWTPQSYIDKLKADVPGVNVEMGRFDHDFILKQSREVGNIVAGWISAP